MLKVTLKMTTLIEVPDLENALENVSEIASENVSNGVENFNEKQNFNPKLLHFSPIKKEINVNSKLSG